MHRFIRMAKRRRTQESREDKEGKKEQVARNIEETFGSN